MHISNEGGVWWGYHTSVKMLAVLRKNSFPVHIQSDIKKYISFKEPECSISRRHAAAKQRRNQTHGERSSKKKKEGQELGLTKEF